jgi:glycosyltransferase involved in cell wall biosynthesis
MRIAHIGDTAGVGSILAAAQRAKGHETDVFVFDDVTARQFGGTRINYRSLVQRWSFFRRLKGYDVWHYHYPYGSLKASLEKRRQGKIFLKHYHGDDLRGKREEEFCAVSTPDLLKFAPAGMWVPTPIDFAEIDSLKPADASGMLVVAHYPYYEGKQMPDYYSAALARLEEKGMCKVTRIANMPHKEALATLTRCDVVVGKILPCIGWFGKFELEGMALGKPAIAHVSDELYEKYRPPVFRTTAETFEQDLAELLRDENERRRLSKEGAGYVRENHDSAKVLKIVEGCYHRLAE